VIFHKVSPLIILFDKGVDKSAELVPKMKAARCSHLKFQNSAANLTAASQV